MDFLSRAIIGPSPRHNPPKGLPPALTDIPGANGCPDCCLAAHAGAAVLPERFAIVTRPMRIAASRVRYFALTTHEMEAAVSNAVNGARAPPARLSLS